MLRIILVSVLALAVFVGCSSKRSGGAAKGDVPVFTDKDLDVHQRRWGEGNIPEAQEGVLFPDINFDYDSAAIPDRYTEVLRKSAQVLANDATLFAEIEGHCDRRGTNDYNLVLGEERAKTVATVLVSYGARASQLSTISYGEEIPIDPSDNDQAYAKNRRVHFALYRSSGEKGR